MEIVPTNSIGYGNSALYRKKVPGGWIVIYVFGEQLGNEACMTYVPDPTYEWENLKEWEQKNSKKS